MGSRSVVPAQPRSLSAEPTLFLKVIPGHPDVVRFEQLVFSVVPLEQRGHGSVDILSLMVVRRLPVPTSRSFAAGAILGSGTTIHPRQNRSYRCHASWKALCYATAPWSKNPHVASSLVSREIPEALTFSGLLGKITCHGHQRLTDLRLNATKGHQSG